jgi:hypothetical protein
LTRKALTNASKALAASPRSPEAHRAKANVLHARGRPEEAILEYETVTAFDRNAVGALGALAWCKFFTGLSTR